MNTTPQAAVSTLSRLHARLVRQLEADAPIGDFHAALEAAAEIAALTAAIEAMQRQGEPWQPIETAPKDGTRVLTFAPKRTEFTQHITTNRFKDAGWLHCNSNCPPTHWQPLPTPPAAATHSEPTP